MAYLDIGGQPTWVVDGGAGPATLVLHGAFHGSEAVLPVLDELAASRRLIAFDRRGHGRTADTTSEFHYETMADEAIAVLETLEIPHADVVGYSDGGIVALHLALRRCDLVRSLVLIGTNIRNSRGRVDFDSRSPATAMMRRAYAALSPDGEDHFEAVAAKSLAMFDDEPNFDVTAFDAISVPALLVVGDRDSVPLEDTATLFRALPRAQLAVVPGASHHVIWERPGEVVALVGRFLRGRGSP
jgi:pimeloyl-ACP methyl ester carboxylesterase